MIVSDVIRPVHELLATQASAHPTRPALSDADDELTYAELEARTASVASRLTDLGVRRGDRVLLLVPNRVALVVWYLAVVRAEGIAVGVNAALGAEELAFILSDSDPVVVVVDDQHASLVERCVRDATATPILLGAEDQGGAAAGPSAASGSSAAPPDGLELDAPAWMLYTSGTTGRPKGVLLSQRSMLWVVAAAWLPFLELTSEDVAVNPLPLFHSYPLDMVLATLAVGAHHHIVERFQVDTVIAALRELSATVLLCVPTTLRYLLNGLPAGEPSQGAPFPALRVVVSAGARPAPALFVEAEQRLEVPVVDAYGSTEASTAVVLNSIRGTRIPGSCGVPAPGWAVRIVDPATRDDVPVGEEGELIARGPGVMLGYHNNPAETAATLRHGWYWTGDLARQDRNGYITITGRLKELIIRGGENIAPAEIEAVALRHPAVADCAVAGRPHETLGEVPVLFVAGRDGMAVAEEDMQQWCAASLPPFKVPAQVVFRDEIPRTASGKVQRHLL